jgi:VCBS repeat-containing protein
VVDTLAISALDGASGQISITVTGAQDIATISGISTGAVAEDGQLTASGQLTIADADSGQSTFVAQVSTTGTYGVFTLSSAGAWTYTLSNASTAVQSLVSGQQVTDTFSAVSIDGLATQSVVITVTGADEVPAAGNPPWSTVFLLAHLNLPVGGLNPGDVVDSSSYGRTIGIGNIGATTSGKFGGAATSQYQNGSALYTSNGSGANIGTGDFTIEWWFKTAYVPQAAANRPPRIFSGLANDASTSLTIWLSRGDSFDGPAGSISLAAPMGGSVTVTTGVSVADGAWHHVAISRVSGVTRIFLDGVMKQSAADMNNYAQWGTAGFYIGCGDWPSGSSTSQPTSTFYTGTFDEIRMCKHGLYSTAFTPPTAEFPNS